MVSTSCNSSCRFLYCLKRLRNLATAIPLLSGSKTLDELVKDSHPFITLTLPGLDSEEETYDYLKGKQTRISQRIVTLRQTKESLEGAVKGLEEALQGMTVEMQEREQASCVEYLDSAWDVITTAEATIGKLTEKESEVTTRIEIHKELEERKRRLAELESREQILRVSGQQSPSPSVQMQALLPRLELPKFSGRRRDWDSFWALFKTNIDDQPISPMMKFNYLLQALTGEARQVASRFQFTEENYSAVIEVLKNKYGKDTSIVEELLAQLESCRAESTTTKHQTNLLDNLTAILMQLSSKGQDVNHRMILNTVLRKFDVEIQLKALERREKLQNTSDWTWSLLQKHLSEILELKERVERSQGTMSQKMTVTPKEKTRPMAPCIYCKRTNHRSVDCKTVPETERSEYLRRNQLCHNCGKPNHKAEDCRSQGCYKCGKKHHSSLCKAGSQVTIDKKQNPQTRWTQPRSDQPPIRNQNQFNQRRRGRGNHLNSGQETNQNVVTYEEAERHDESDPESGNAVNQVGTSEPQLEGTLLLTGITTIQGPHESKEVRILLDTGSELSFIHSKLVDELQLPIEGSSSLRIKTFGSNQSSERQHRIIHVNLIDKQGQVHKCELFDSPVITSKVNAPILSPKDLQYIKESELNLSSNPGSQEQPQILLGCDYLWEIMEGKKHKLPSGLHLISTKFGYMVSGKKLEASETKPKKVLRTEIEHDNIKALEKYWTLESSGINEYTGTEKREKQLLDEQVIKKFKETTVKRPDGYYVRLPWKNDQANLPDNKGMAVARLRSLFRQYRNRQEELQEVDTIFKKQLEQGILEKVPEKPLQNEHKRIHYLSYQVITNPEKKTTPKRIVFDASAHAVGKPSLNDMLHQGPLLLPNLLGILMRFRTGKIATTADIEKAFLQVRLHEEDRDVTRFLWVKDLKKPPDDYNIITFRFTRVTFGLNSSPFLLAATIDLHLDTTNDDREVANQIRKNLYVDNLLLTAESKNEAFQQYKEAKRIFNALNMNMREFISNDSNLMKLIAEEDKASCPTPKVLGVKWNTAEDKLIIKCDPLEANFTTKRTVLQTNASVYDPMGWLIPLLIRSKCFFQSLWKKQYTWDDILDQEDREQWKKITDAMKGFEKELPRRVANKNAQHQLVIFSDASIAAMAACTYVKNDHEQYLLMAKSKLPSIKAAHTVPKLEMNAMTMAARMSLTAFEELSDTITIDSIYLLSDSEIVLNWLKNADETKTTGVLVTNRVNEVRRITEKLTEEGVKVYFGYVNTRVNPAGCATRGLTADEFQNHLWWNGPEFLKNQQQQWPNETRLFQLSQTTNAILQLSAATAPEPLFPYKRFRSYLALKRTVAIVLRFLQRCAVNLSQQTKDKLKKIHNLQNDLEGKGAITAEEVQNAQSVILKDHQHHFLNSIKVSTQRKLNVREDKNGIWRCYGRLGKSYLAEDAKNPVLIAPHTDLAALIIREAHGTFHRSTAHTMAEVRRKYWIPKLRQQVKQVLRKCIPCQRYNNFPYRYPQLADLPAERVRQSRPFQDIGLDLFGPLKTRSTDGVRKKAYGCIFTCSTTRMLHIELIKDSSTTCFLNAVRRFMSRRGVPNSITCDNAPTFMLAEQILTSTLDVEQEIQSFMTKTDIKWRRITPYAPWQGGFYERLIKDIKRALFKALGRKITDEDSLNTILAEIEGCLNSRPLTYLEASPEDFEPIRPIDFLQNRLSITYKTNTDEGESNDPNFYPRDEAIQLRTRMEAEKALKSSCEVVDKFWKIWNDSYLTSLREQHRRDLHQGRTTVTSPMLGQIVLLHDPMQPRNKWKLGKIIKLQTANDGKVREVQLKMGNGNIVKRPVNLLVPLEVGHDSEEQEETLPIHSESSQSISNSPIYNFRPRKAQKTDCISEEHEVYTVQMDAREAAVRLLNSLNVKTKSLFEEKELQRRLDVLYHDITTNLHDIRVMQERFEEIQVEMAQGKPPEELKEVHEDLSNIHKDLLLAKQRMTANWQLGDILWEIYNLLIQGGAASKESKHEFETRKRKERRDNSRVISANILLREIAHVDEFIAAVEKVKVEYFVESPREDVVAERLLHMQSLLEEIAATPAPGLAQQAELERRMENTNLLLEAVNKKIDEAVIKIQRHIEVLVDAQINYLVQTKRGQETKEEPQDELHMEETDDEATSEPLPQMHVLEEPRHIKQARAKLETLKGVKERHFGNAPIFLVTEGHKAPVCCFCGAIGKHESDTCHHVVYVEKRKQIIRDKELCYFCLQKCQKPFLYLCEAALENLIERKPRFQLQSCGTPPRDR
ncbi:integrase core domain protein [Ancylostoma ceylanicum]|uniref:Integrase core domain protein n=1 Tax=Ancylostoma ceylanicum TaxID=53326 RepID=A0A0D6LJF5_9BILA|nr:integrase core domain protein [Ancylostoma ceylanicum]